MSTVIDYSAATTVSQAAVTRRSLRAFLPKEIPREITHEILKKAARAPSGTNMQPWQVTVVSGHSRQLLCKAVCDAFDNEQAQHKGEVRYYPEKWFEPYLSRRRAVGWGLYDLLGIKKGDREKTHAQHRRNFVFFDAPVGMIFTIHRDLATGSWLDYGMFLENIMLLAREAGLHTCPQAAWADFHQIIRRVLSIDDEQVVVCGLALGYADPEAIENSLVTARCSVDEFVRFLD
ncbi:MAG: nitroreductase [Granulosicoccus sp.]